MKKNGMYNVRPRYTCGSPGLVPEHIARRLAEEEKIAFQRYLSGVYGEEGVTKAQKEGLVGIADVYTEKRDHWIVEDLITREVYKKYFTDTVVTKKKLKYVQDNRQDGWRIEKAWTMDNYVVIKYVNGVHDKLYKAQLEWIREIEPQAEIVWG
jgi:hypothetical protein